MKKDEIITLYNERIDKLGNIPSSAGWKDLETQYLRFTELTDSLEINNSSRILDLGCGYGALIDYFKTIKVKIKEENYFPCENKDVLMKTRMKKLDSVQIINEYIKIPHYSYE